MRTAIARRKAAFMEAVQGAWVDKPKMYLPGKHQPRPIGTATQATPDQAAAERATQAPPSTASQTPSEAAPTESAAEQSRLLLQVIAQRRPEARDKETDKASTAESASSASNDTENLAQDVDFYDMAKAMRRVLHDLSKHKQLPTKMDQDILNALAEALHTIPGALTSMIDEIEVQFHYAKIETETPDLAAPMAYALEVSNRDWHTVKPRYQLAIKKLCERAIDLPSGFIALYTTSVCTEPLEKSPQIPSLFSLDPSALAQLCEDMGVEIPDSAGYNEQKAARNRLGDHPRQYILSQKLCKLYEDDLKWLATQENVLGAGTVVRLSSELKQVNPIKPAIILRPIVRHIYIEGTAIQRKLHYVTHLQRSLQPETLQNT